MENIRDTILDFKVSYQTNTWTDLSVEMTIKDTLTLIQSDKFENVISNLRLLLSENRKEEYSSHKKMLPSVTFCGTFEMKRRKENLKVYNSIVVIDIDKLKTNDLQLIKNILSIDEFVFAFWKSPSNEGLKGLVQIIYNFDIENFDIHIIHKNAFEKISNYFKNKYDIELDQSGSDITRLCFFSFDPNLVIKENFNPFEVNEISSLKVDKIIIKPTDKVVFANSRDTLFNPKNKNNQSDRNIISLIIKFLERKNLSITSTYLEWYKVAMVISNTFTYDVGEKYFIKLSKLDKDKFDENNCKNFLVHCYESSKGQLKFNSIIYLANIKGYFTKHQKLRGSEVEGESLSQVSSSKTVFHLPEDLNK